LTGIFTHGNGALNLRMYQKFAQAFGMVMQVFFLSLAGFVVGYGLDTVVVVSKPWLSIILAFGGISLGFYRLYKWYINDSNTST